jgi:hypothetical protein
MQLPYADTVEKLEAFLPWHFKKQPAAILLPGPPQGCSRGTTHLADERKGELFHGNRS